MAFIDFLALQEGLLLMAAALVGYVGAIAYLAMRRNDAAAFRSALKGAAAPIGMLGAVTTILAVWGELVWQYPGPYLLAYNIYFNDVYTLFGLTLVALAVSMGFSLKLQYAGLFALVAGGITIAYGWNGWQLGLTKEPFDTFLLFGAFGLAGILAFPVTVMTDHFAAHPDGTAFAFAWKTQVRRSLSIQSSARAAQPIVPMSTDGKPDTSRAIRLPFRLPIWVTLSTLAFIVVMGLAAFAALYFLDTTLPAHLATPP
ncbi:MAG TPA: DUF981 family protein [Thermoplasmata archaeon]|nr:DUF981 family protein [Thermoplasmata archaeon]